MQITSIVPGCYHLEGPTSCTLLGSPPKILKAILKQKEKSSCRSFAGYLSGKWCFTNSDEKPWGGGRRLRKVAVL
jgi:hypothetical protein